jgi:hypothetical protein
MRAEQPIAMPSSWPASELRVRAAQLRAPDRLHEVLRRDSEPVARWAAALATVEREMPLRAEQDEPVRARCAGCDRCSGRKTVARGVRARKARQA